MRKNKILFTVGVIGLLLVISAGLVFGYWYYTEVASHVISDDLPGEQQVLIKNELGDDQQSENVLIHLGDQSYTLSAAEGAQVALPPVSGLQPYQLSGEAVMKSGQRLRITGHGVMLPDEYLLDGMRQAKTMADFFTVWQRLAGLLNPYQAKLSLRSTDGPFTPDEIAKAEKRLGVKLPAYYLNLAHDQRGWLVSRDGTHQVFRLLAPSELISAAAWTEQFNGRPDWKASQPQQYARLEKDIVFAVSDGEPWIMRYGAKLCEGGLPSFDSGYIEHEDFLVEDSDPFHDYFGTTGYCHRDADLARWHYLMSASLRDALPRTFAFVKPGNSLSISRGDAAGDGTLPLYLQGTWF